MRKTNLSCRKTLEDEEIFVQKIPNLEVISPLRSREYERKKKFIVEEDTGRWGQILSVNPDSRPHINLKL